ncbi:hypothetical protein [Streptacidiphilus sp. MAP5-3]
MPSNTAQTNYTPKPGDTPKGCCLAVACTIVLGILLFGVLFLLGPKG